METGFPDTAAVVSGETFSAETAYIEGCRRWFSDLKLLKNKKLYKEFKSIVKDFIK